MAFLRAGSSPELPDWIGGERVVLRAPQIGDYASWAELRAMSRAHLRPWEPAWPADDLTRSAFRRRVRHYQREARSDQGYAFLIFLRDDLTLIGGVALTNVQRGVTQSASLGYWLGRPFTGQGLMTEAVRSVVAFAFETLRLHRIEAATQPTNLPSIGVLERNGFLREGYARQYLRIDGAWRDHLLYAVLDDRETVR
jgi:ribosomal-protein-alanine N-acetyltransferase